MPYTATQTKNRERGTTLVELLVTLTIFAFVTIVVTTSFFSIVSSRNQIEASQQINDEFRLLIDTLEIEIASGSDFLTSNCSAGVCRTISFSVATRPDLNPYRVTYTHDTNTGRILKTMQRNDGVCKSHPLGSSCTFPITSENIVVSFVNFDVVLAGTGAQRPLVVVTIEGEGESDVGETIPLSYSTSYNPRTMQNVSDVTTVVDNIRPSIIFDYIVPGTGSATGCGVYSDAALTQPYNNDINFTPNQSNIPHVYTDCELVKVSFVAYDRETGLAGGRYDGNVNVTGGLCGGRACSVSPTSVYSLPFGFTLGTSQDVVFVYDDIPLRPGIGKDGHAQLLDFRVRDMQGNINSPLTRIWVYQMSSEVPLSTEGMVGLARLDCPTQGNPHIMLLVAPSENNSVYQRNIRWYRCTASGETDTCHPKDDGYYAGELELQWWGSRLRWRENAGSGNWAGYEFGYTYWYTIYNYWQIDQANPRPSISRNTLYRYGFTVYDRFNPARESEIKLVEWNRGFNTILSSNPLTANNIGIVDSSTRFAEGRAFSSTPYIGVIPNDFCAPTGDTTDGTGDVGNVGDGSDGDGFGGGDVPPPPLYTILPSVSGVWTATVTLVGGGSVFTNSIPITMSGTAPSVLISVKSITPTQEGVVLNPLGVGLTQDAPTRNIFLRIPSDIAVGTYQVELELSGANAPAEQIVVPLYVSLQSGGAT